MTVTDTIAPTSQYQHIDVALIDPPYDNRDLGDLEGLTASIRQHGVLIPILLTPEGDRYRIVAGARRLHAAIAAELPAIPALVRERDAATSTLHQATENLQRKDYTHLEKAQVYRNLLDERDCSQRDLAELLGVNQSDISRHLALLELPAKAQRALDAGSISAEEAVELTKLKDHPKRIGHVLDRQYGTVRSNVDSQLHELELNRKLDERKAALDKAGTTYRVGGTSPSGWRELSWDLHLDQRAQKAHAKEVCHAIVIHVGGHESTYCSKPDRHTKTGDSDIKTTARSSGPGKSDAQKKKEKAEREARAQRRDFMMGVLERRPSKTRVADELLDRALATVYHDDAKRMVDLLDLEPYTKRDYVMGGQKDVPDWQGTVTAYAAAGPTERLQTILAYLFVQGETHDHNQGELHRRLLAELGYRPHPSEKAAFTKAGKAKR